MDRNDPRLLPEPASKHTEGKASLSLVSGEVSDAETILNFFPSPSPLSSLLWRFGDGNGRDWEDTGIC